MNDTIHLPSDTPTASTDPAQGPQRQLRIVHLVLGVLFLGIAAIWGLAASDTVQLDVSVAVVLPMVLILAGVAGLAAMIANASRGRRQKSSYDS